MCVCGAACTAPWPPGPVEHLILCCLSLLLVDSPRSLFSRLFSPTSACFTTALLPCLPPLSSFPPPPPPPPPSLSLLPPFASFPVFNQVSLFLCSFPFLFSPPPFPTPLLFLLCPAPPFSFSGIHHMDTHHHHLATTHLSPSPHRPDKVYNNLFLPNWINLSVFRQAAKKKKTEKK